MSADPEVSEGARLERAVVRKRLRRQIKYYGEASSAGVALKVELDWILAREKRYNEKVGGLGRK